MKKKAIMQRSCGRCFLHFTIGIADRATKVSHSVTMRPKSLLGFAQPLTLVSSFASLCSFWPRQFVSSRTWAPLNHHRPSFFALVLASMGKKKSQKFYGIHVGRDGFRGVVGDWATCQTKVNGVPGAVFKSFPTRAEAVVFSEAGRGESTAGRAGPSVTLAISKQARRPRTSLPPLSSSTANSARNPSFYVDRRPGSAEPRGREVASVASEPAPRVPPLPSTSRRKRTIVIYTDGACTNNGKASAKAGVGVFFGPDDELNVSEKLSGETQTNQRAEQTGVLRAMQLALAMGRVGPGDTLCIKTDSNVSSFVS